MSCRRCEGDAYGMCVVCNATEKAKERDAEIADLRAKLAEAERERDVLFDALNLHMRSTGITSEAMERVEAFRAVIANNEPRVRGECRRLEAGWRAEADARKAAEAKLAEATAACAEMRAALEAVGRERNPHSDGHVDRLVRTALSRPDLGRGPKGGAA